MLIDPGAAIDVLGGVPSAVWVIVLLGGPTAIWLLYRFVVQPRTNHSGEGSTDVLWVCERCRSAIEIRLSRCYRCGLERELTVGALEVIDGDGIVALPPADLLEPELVPVMDARGPAREPAREPGPIAVSPGRAAPGTPTLVSPAATRPRRAKVAAGHRDAAERRDAVATSPADGIDPPD